MTFCYLARISKAQTCMPPLHGSGDKSFAQLMRSLTVWIMDMSNEKQDDSFGIHL